MISDNFENIFMHCNEHEIEQYIKQYNINVNYDDGYFLDQLICMKNDLNLLKMMINNKANIHINN